MYFVPLAALAHEAAVGPRSGWMVSSTARRSYLEAETPDVFLASSLHCSAASLICCSNCCRNMLAASHQARAISASRCFLGPLCLLFCHLEGQDLFFDVKPPIHDVSPQGNKRPSSRQHAFLPGVHSQSTLLNGAGACPPATAERCSSQHAGTVWAHVLCGADNACSVDIWEHMRCLQIPSDILVDINRSVMLC